MVVQAYNNQITTVENFLDTIACKLMVDRAEAIGFSAADVGLQSGAKLLKNVRNNMRCRFDDAVLAKQMFQPSQIFVPEYWDKARVFGLNELFRVYKYEPTQRFKMHRDGVVNISEQVQSAFTWMIYLNDDFQGGYTAFEDGLLIQPKQGMLLVFPHNLKHESQIVAVGEKYVLRNDVFYKQNESSDDDITIMQHDYNLTFCEVVAAVFDEFLKSLNYEVVQNERAAWCADYKYKNYTLNQSILFKYSGYPDSPGYYQIIIKNSKHQLHLEQLCTKLQPGYTANQDQYTQLVKNDFRQLLRVDLKDKMCRHLWEMKLLCLSALTNNAET